MPIDVLWNELQICTFYIVGDSTAYDVFLMHAEGDSQASKLRDLMQRVVQNLETGQPLRVCIEDDFLDKTTDRSQLLQLALANSARHFIFFNDDGMP